MQKTAAGESMRRIIDILYIINLLSYILQYKTISNTFTSVFSIGTIIIMSYFIFIKRKVEANTTIIKICLYIVAIFTVYSIIFSNTVFRHEIIRNAMMFFMFIVNIFLISSYYFIEKREKVFLSITYAVLTFSIVISYILYFDNFEVFKDLSLIFERYDRYRNPFGFYHPNTAGMMCLTALLVSHFIRKIKRQKLLNKRLPFDIISFLMMISTSSRNCILCFILFIVLNHLFINKKKIIKFISKVNEKNKMILSFGIAMISITICIIAVYLFFINIDPEVINTALFNSNRMFNFTVNVPLIFKLKKEFTGLGLVTPESYFKFYADYYGTTYVDNWYLYVFMSIGIIGFIGVLIVLIALFRALFRSYGDKMYIPSESVKSLFIINLVNSLFESDFLVPHMIISYISWIIYFLFILNCTRKRKVKSYG